MKDKRTPDRSWDKLDTLVIGVIICLGALLFVNRAYYQVPASDFFNFLREASYYVRGQFPPVVHDPPLFPLLVIGFSRILPVRYPEVLAGRLLTISLYLGVVYLFWRISRRLIGRSALVSVLLLITNPLSYYLALQPLITMSFVFFILWSLSVWMDHRYRWLYLAAGMSYFIKNEAIFLFVAFGCVDLFSTRDKYRAVVLIGLAVIPALLWEVTIFLVSRNQYFLEMVGFHRQLPNVGFLFDTFLRAPFIGLSFSFPAVCFVALFVVLGTVQAIRIRSKPGIAIVLFVFFYSLIHLAVAGDAKRWAYPIMWALYLMLVWSVNLTIRRGPRQLMKTGYVIAFLIIVSNSYSMSGYMSVEHTKGYENALLGLWTRELHIERPTLLITVNHAVAAYYIDNPQIQYFQFDRFLSCASLLCGLDGYMKERAYDVLFLYEDSPAQSLFEVNYYKPIKDKMREFMQTQWTKLELVQSYHEREKTVRLYRYNKT